MSVRIPRKKRFKKIDRSLRHYQDDELRKIVQTYLDQYTGNLLSADTLAAQFYTYPDDVNRILEELGYHGVKKETEPVIYFIRK